MCWSGNNRMWDISFKNVNKEEKGKRGGDSKLILKYLFIRDIGKFYHITIIFKNIIYKLSNFKNKGVNFTVSHSTFISFISTIKNIKFQKKALLL